jgi:hypothetical protein
MWETRLLIYPSTITPLPQLHSCHREPMTATCYIHNQVYCLPGKGGCAFFEHYPLASQISCRLELAFSVVVSSMPWCLAFCDPPASCLIIRKYRKLPDPPEVQEPYLTKS